MLQNEHLLAKMRLDTSENEPSEASSKEGFRNGRIWGHGSGDRVQRDAESFFVLRVGDEGSS